MTDIEKREKVISGLKYCLDRSKEKLHCGDCPYWQDDFESGCHIYDMMRDALALLNKQEPRVLEYSEIKKHPLVWLEDNDKEDVIPALFLQYSGWNAEFSVQAPDEWVDTIIRSSIVIAVEETYGITWRAWTARPSEEQRKAVKWDEYHTGDDGRR